jgi:hypothetical protein
MHKRRNFLSEARKNNNINNITTTVVQVKVSHIEVVKLFFYVPKQITHIHSINNISYFGTMLLIDLRLDLFQEIFDNLFEIARK